MASEWNNVGPHLQYQYEFLVDAATEWSFQHPWTENGGGWCRPKNDDIEVFNVVNNKWYYKRLQTGLYYPAGAGTGTALMFTENDGLLAGTGQQPVQVYRVTGEPPSIAP